MQNLKLKLKGKLYNFLRRKIRINAKIKSWQPDFRIVVNKSNKYIKAQVLDSNWNVQCYVIDKEKKWDTKVQRAENAWIQLAKLMIDKSIKKASFDRNGNLYHWRIKAFTDWIRKWWINI
jgi:large subunit ribosomal protein L18